jgi:hypothetical protein
MILVGAGSKPALIISNSTSKSKIFFYRKDVGLHKEKNNQDDASLVN